MALRKICQNLLLISALVFCLWQACFLYQNVVFHGQVLRDAGFDYQRVRASMTGTLAAQRTRQLLPPGAKIELFPAAWDIDAVALRYELYPVEIRPRGDYVLARKPTRGEIPTEWPKKDLPDGMELYAKPGHSFSDNPITPQPQRFPVIAMQALGIFFFQVMVGYGLLKNLGISLFRQNPGFAAVTWYLSGSLLLALLLWGFLLLGGQLTRASVVVIWALTLTVLVLADRIKQRHAQVLPDPAWASHPSTPWFAIKLICRQGLTLVIVGAVFFCAVSLPVNNWDAMSHWVMKAKVFFHQGTLALDYTHSNYYPLLWPLHIAAQFALVGSTADPLARWASGFFFGALVSQVAEGLALLRLQSWQRSVVTGLFLLSFFHEPLRDWWAVQFTFAHAENIFLAYLTATLVSCLLLISRPQDQRYRTLAVLMAAGLAAAKMEGGASLLFVVLALVLSKDTVSPWGPELRRGGQLLLALVIPLGWIWWARAHGYFSEVYHLRYPLNFEKLSVLGATWARNLASSSTPQLVLFALVSLRVFAPRRKWTREERFLLAAGVFLSLFVIVAFLGWSEEKIAADFYDVSSRLFLHAVPALVLAWASRVFNRDPA